MVVDIRDIITCFKFGNDRLTGLASAEGQILPFPNTTVWAYDMLSRAKNEKLIKKKAYMKTETCRLYSRVFGIYLPNVIKIDHYNFWAIPFQIWCIFETEYLVNIWTRVWSLILGQSCVTDWQYRLLMFINTESLSKTKHNFTFRMGLLFGPPCRSYSDSTSSVGLRGWC